MMGYFTGSASALGLAAVAPDPVGIGAALLLGAYLVYHRAKRHRKETVGP